MRAVIGPTPRYCRPPAFQHFRAQLDDLEGSQGLVGAATAIAMHAMAEHLHAGVAHGLLHSGDLVRRRVLAEVAGIELHVREAQLL